MKSKLLVLAVLILLPAVFMALGPQSLTAASSDAKQSSQLKDNGIGPVKSVTLGKTIDKKMVDEGQSIFFGKCSLCHAMNSQKLAPPLAGVTKTLSPVFIMNYLLNTAQMQEKDPYIQQLMQYYQSVPKMPDQNLSKSQARAVLEFLRSTEK